MKSSQLWFTTQKKKIVKIDVKFVVYQNNSNNNVEFSYLYILKNFRGCFGKNNTFFFIFHTILQNYWYLIHHLSFFYANNKYQLLWKILYSYTYYLENKIKMPYHDLVILRPFVCHNFYHNWIICMTTIDKWSL